VVRLLCSYDRSDGDTLASMRKYLAEMPCMCCLDGGLRCPPHGPADGFVDVLPCNVQTGTRGSPAPMGDGWRSLPSRPFRVLTGSRQHGARRNACMPHGFNRSVKQLSAGSMSGHLCRRRLRKATGGIRGLGTMTTWTAGMGRRWACPVGVLLRDSASRLECWIR
jgi:hypothetical protein